MKVIQVYKCLCDVQRLRILNLLKDGPLCVCHLMDILDANQVKISKQLKYMKDLGMVQAERQAQWMIYSLPTPVPTLLAENLKCLQDCAATELCFRDDLRKRAKVIAQIRRSPDNCAPLLEAVCCEKPETCTK